MSGKILKAFLFNILNHLKRFAVSGRFSDETFFKVCMAYITSETYCVLKQEREQQLGEEKAVKSQKQKEEDRKRIREEKARLARLTAIQVCLFVFHTHLFMKDKIPFLWF